MGWEDMTMEVFSAKEKIPMTGFITTQEDALMIFVQMWEYLMKKYDNVKPEVNGQWKMTFSLVPHNLTGILATSTPCHFTLSIAKLDSEDDKNNLFVHLS